MRRAAVFLAAFVAAPSAMAQDSAPERPACPQELLDSGGICLTKEQKEKLRAAVKELDDIHKSKAEVEIKEPIVIVRDWEDRVYINGGEKKPIGMKLKIGEHVDRDMEIQLPIRVYYREEPPDPWFRLRVRFQAGILVPEAIRSIRNDDNGNDDTGLEEFWDLAFALDFFHYESLNLSIQVGARALGGGVGVDLTQNFGFHVAPVVTYDGWNPSLWLGPYFSFN